MTDPQAKMEYIDTPPQTPTTPIDLTEPNRRDLPIHIDGQGIHDFDTKKAPDGSRKLKKASRRSVQLSISSISDHLPQRTPSDGSDRSIRKRFSSLLVGTGGGPAAAAAAAEKLQKCSGAKSPEILEDPLPDTKKELEVRLNYHLSELDMLKKTLASANEVVRLHFERYEILQGRSSADMKHAMRKQEQMVDQARTNRDSYVTFVAFHRRQLERIKKKRIAIEKDAGLEPTLPEVYKSLWGDEEWGQLFKA